MDNKLYIGVDFSYNSCGVTFICGESINHVCIFNKNQIKKNEVELTDEEAYKELEILKLIESPQCINVLHHRDKVPQVKDIGLLAWERIHIGQTIMHSDLAYNTIVTYVQTNYRHVHPRNIYIAFENYSYTKATDNLIQMCEMTAPVKQQLIKNFLDIVNLENFFVVTAPTIKKFAGKGDFDKYQMFQAFLQEDFKGNNKFQNALKKDEEKFFKPRIKKGKLFNDMIAPVPDIIDSYYIAKWLKEQVKV